MRSTAADARAEIVAAAARSFAERGYQGTSLSEIAAALGRSKAAVLYHFPTKVAILREIVEPPTRAMIDLVERCEPMDRDEARIEAALGFVDIAIEHHDALASYPSPLRNIPDMKELADLDLIKVGRRLKHLIDPGEGELQDLVSIRVLLNGVVTCTAVIGADVSHSELRMALRIVVLRILGLPSRYATDTENQS